MKIYVVAMELFKKKKKGWKYDETQFTIQVDGFLVSPLMEC